MLMLGSLPLGVLSSMIKCVVCVVMSSPLILIGTTPLCLGGILRVDFTVPIVALWVLTYVKVKNYHFIVYSIVCPYPKCKIMRTSSISMLKISSVLGNWSQIIKLCVNLKSAIHRCNAVDPKVVISEPSAVLSLTAVGCIGVL